MKLNKILMVLAATAIVGCTSDDLNDFSAKQSPEDSRMIQLDENFVLAGVGLNGDMTRTHWTQDPETKALVNKFLPIYGKDFSAGDMLSDDADLDQQSVGLCWLGDTPGAEVYTNYQFYHFGWLNNDETEADLDKCGTLYNGALYSDITMTAATADAEAVPATDWGVAGLPAQAVKGGNDNLNYNSGVYKTDNKTIFGGDYIVYYPYDPNFQEKGTIPAVAKTSFDWDINNDTYESPELGKATFRYSGKVTIDGGYQAADFGMYNLSTLVRVRVSTVKLDGMQHDNIDQVVLYSESGQFIKQANLAANKIADGLKGTALYAETTPTKTISVDFSAAATDLDVKASTDVSAYITVLPTTVNDLVALVHDASENKWARVAMDPIEFKAGSAQVVDITVKESDLTSDFIAVDDASLLTALTEARNVPASATAPQTITVIGDITLETSPFLITNAKDEFITIKGGDIIVPQDKILRVSTNMESNIRVLGKSCCTGAKGGQLGVYGGTINNVTLEPTEARVTDATYDTYNPYLVYNSAATVAAGKTIDVQAGNVIVRDAVEHKGNLTIAEGAKLYVDGETYNGDIQFMGSNVTNAGTIEVSKGGKFDMVDEDGNSTAVDGQRMTNTGTFIHNVDAGVGTAVQNMKQQGEYRCRVDEQIKLDDAFLQWTACSVIELVNTADYDYNLATGEGVSFKHNNKFIDFEVNTPGATTTFAKNTVTAKDSKTINVGNLTVTAATLFEVNYAFDKDNRRTLNVNGNMVVKAPTNLNGAKEINVTGNVNVEGEELYYKGGFIGTSDKLNNGKFAVTGDITVKDGYFNASDVDSRNITCANFYLKDASNAEFGNRTDGAAQTMTVTGTISNPKYCTFDIKAANQDGNGSVLAWITCAKLEIGGTFTGARPRTK